MFDLHVNTDPAWLELVRGSFDEFLLDHTLCERKASAMGMSLVAKYPSKSLILDELIAFAREELEHFHTMYRVIAARGLTLPNDEKDEYVNALRERMVKGNPELVFLDRLLVCGIVEARGCERLMLVSDSLPEGELKEIYLEVTRAEARHRGLFFRLARRYFELERVQARASELLAAEAEIVRHLPLRARVH